MTKFGELLPSAGRGEAPRLSGSPFRMQLSDVDPFCPIGFTVGIPEGQLFGQFFDLEFISGVIHGVARLVPIMTAVRHRKLTAQQIRFLPCTMQGQQLGFKRVTAQLGTIVRFSDLRGLRKCPGFRL